MIYSRKMNDDEYNVCLLKDYQWAPKASIANRLKGGNRFTRVFKGEKFGFLEWFDGKYYQLSGEWNSVRSRLMYCNAEVVFRGGKRLINIFYSAIWAKFIWRNIIKKK
jgi:hypothetical protein